MSIGRLRRNIHRDKLAQVLKLGVTEHRHASATEPRPRCGAPLPSKPKKPPPPQYAAKRLRKLQRRQKAA